MYDTEILEIMENRRRDVNNGNILRSFRKDYDISVKSLAKMLNIGVSSLYFYERGDRPIPDRVVQLLNQMYMLNLVYTGNKPLLPCFNRKLKQLRLNDDISQINFADILNVDLKFIQSIESGKKDLSLPIDFLYHLQKCNYDLNWLFKEERND